MIEDREPLPPRYTNDFVVVHSGERFVSLTIKTLDVLAKLLGKKVVH